MNVCTDQLEDAGEISDLLARSYGTPNDIDEDDLEAELAGLGDELEAIDAQEEVPSYLLPTPSVTLPAQPTASISNPTKPVINELNVL